MLHRNHEGITRTHTADALNCRVEIDYTNYKGERSRRVIVPHNIWHGTTDYHPKPQWLMTAWDVDKHQLRTFAIADIHEWKDLGQHHSGPTIKMTMSPVPPKVKQ